MAGVLFIIWIPCERYEEVLTNKQIWDRSALVKEGPQQFTSSSEEEVNFLKESKPSSSLETFAISIESDSLNRDDKKNAGTDKKKTFQKTKSFDDLTKEDKEKSPDDRSREKGSMDSDTFRRLAKDRAHLKENEEAVDKFFRANMDRQPLDENASMERVMREIIERIRIRNSSWVRVNNGNSYQITFSLQNGVRCDDTIHMLSEFGIGEKEGSSIAVVPCTLYRDRNLFKTDDDEESSSAQSVLKETAWNKFIGTVRARMNVAKIVEAVKTDASLTFDFIILVIVASILACFGLVENSTLFLAASMLISPLMGPILAATFGAVIKDHKLQYWGIRNEIFGIFLCIFVGFFFGLIISGLDYITGNQIQGGLTPEMLMRTELHSVVVGILIALPSGAAVAIAVLGDNFGSLVGVAISASLLPPACNTGLFWSYSFIHMIFKDQGFNILVTTTKYSNDQAYEQLARGGISLCVTLTNVLCIYFMGFVFLKVKEVVPVSDDQRQFWKHDIKIARDYNKTINAEEGKKLREELAEFHQNASENFKGVGAELLKASHYPHTNTWSPLTLRHHRKESYNNQASLRELDGLLGLTNKNVPSERHHRHYSFGRSSSPTHDNNHTESNKVKQSNPILMPNRQNVDYIKCGSAPLEIITEIPRKIQHESTVVTFAGQPGPSGERLRKFIVTPAHDPLI